jgi:thiosulfate/3-mercaptopyruvate sulfurtransferase
MYAASCGKVGIVAVLLEAGADPRLRNQDDFAAVELASTWDCLTLLRGAVRHAEPGDRAIDGNRTLIRAAG